jgi:LacI family transcriptional regulator
MSQEGRAPDDLSAFCCQNPDCSDYGQRGQGNLTVPARYGPQQRRLLRCKTCKHRFSERRGTPLFDSHLSEDKVVAVLHHIAEGCGVRQTSRLVGVNKDTVTRLCLLAGDQAQQLHDELVAFSPPDARGPVRRKVVVRGQEGKALRPRRPRR